MAELSDLPELVRQFRLKTVINQTQTIHTLLRGQRSLPSRVTWKRVTERPLGHGGYGEVWLEKRLDDGQDQTPALRAVKSIYTNASSQRRDYVRELEALAKFSSNSHKYAPFFVQFYGWYETPGRLHAAMEYCEYGDLNNYIKSMGSLTEKETKDITWQVLGGLSLMHEAKFAHRDVKPANILIKSRPPAEWWVKLCDLGLSKRAEDSASATVMRGTPGFMAPEKLGLNSEDTNGVEEVDPFPADMWCLGETISHAVTGHGTFEPHASFYRYASGASDFPRASFRKHSVSEECIDFIQSLMSPRPKDRLLANQALFHPWIAIEDESERYPIVDVEESPIIPCVEDEQTQHTQASAEWTQETVKCMDNVSDPSDEGFQDSQDDDKSVTIRTGMDGIVADKRNTEGLLGDSGRHLKVEERSERSYFSHRSAGPDKDDYSQSKESSRTESEASDLREHAPMNTAYIEDADEDGNLIEGTIVYPGRGRRQSSADNVEYREVFQQNEIQPHHRPRSPSPVGQEQQTPKQATQDRDVYSCNGHTQDLVDTGPSSHPKFTVEFGDGRDRDETARYLDTLTFEYYPTAFDTDPNRVWLADNFGNVHGLARESRQISDSDSDSHSDQQDQEMDASVMDGTRPGSVEMREARPIGRGEGSYLRSFWDEYDSDYDSNAITSSNHRQTRRELLHENQKWRHMPDNATIYCPSVSTISIIDSEEGTQPYAFKRIQRDFPREWQQHLERTNWHQHRLRLYNKPSQGKRQHSVRVSLSGEIRPILKRASSPIRGKQAPKKTVRFDDDPRERNIRRNQRFPINSTSTQLRGLDLPETSRPGNYRGPTNGHVPDGEEERRRLGASVVNRWLYGSLNRKTFDEALY